MLQFRNLTQVYIGACVCTAIALLAMQIHIQINYDADMREIVRLKATLATGCVALPMSLFVFHQMLKNYQLSARLQSIINRDRLTDAATRDFFFDVMERDKTAFGVSLMVDIDHFKRVNDTYGHLVGDEVIRSVAAVLRQQTREDDIVCRFGGEEFVIFLQDANAARGEDVAHRICAAVKAACITVEDTIICVTVSIGGSLKQATEDVERSIKQADDALYVAKRDGRDRVVLEWDAPAA